MVRPVVILSNQIEQLCIALKERLFASMDDPFRPRLVVVPTLAMKGWLRQQIAADHELRVATGLQFLFLEEAMLRIREEAPPPSRFELALKLEKFLPQERRKRASELAELFSLCALYGSKPTEEPELMLQVYDKEWAYVLQYSKKPKEGAIPLHLFGFSHLPSTYLQILLQTPVSLYILSPCHLFWEDVRSDRERRALKRHHRLEGAKESQLRDLDRFLRDRNPLLANLGRLGREFSRQLLDIDVDTVENYQIRGEESALEKVQSELLSLQSSESPLDADGSIEIHSSPTKRREVEVLHSCIRRLIAERGILPSQILVMAPEITPYAPYIEAKFKAEDPCIPIQLHAPSQQCHGLQLLFQLAKSRWTVVDVLRVLAYPPLAMRYDLTTDSLSKVKEWAEGAALRWGWDVPHRDRLLRAAYGEQSMMDRRPTGTWRRLFSMLIQAVAFDLEDEEVMDQERWLPAKIVLESSELPLLGTLHSLLHALYDQLQPLMQEQPLRLDQWLEHLQRLQSSFFDGESGTWLDPLRRACPHLPTELFPFSTLALLLEQAWQRSSLGPSLQDPSSLSMGSLQGLRALPAQVVILLGLDESQFPRRAKGYLPKELPSVADIDRYLFLEALLSARHSLIVIYKNRCEETGAPLGPSLVLSDLLRRLPESAHVRHPTTAFHENYFTKQSHESSFLFRLARTSQEKAKPVYFHAWNPPKAELPEGERSLSVRMFCKSVRDPIRTFYNAALGLYLSPEETLSDGEPFNVEKFELDRLAWQALSRPVEAVVRAAERRISLPLDPFRQELQQNIEKKGVELRGQLAAFGLRPEDLYPLSVDMLEVSVTDRLRVLLVGEIPCASAQGLVVNKECRLREFLRAWPLYLLYCCCQPCPRDILFLKSTKRLSINLTDPLAHLRNLIEYVLLCQEELLPLPIECFEAVNEGDAEKCYKEFQKKLESPFLEYLASIGELPPWPQLQERWQLLGAKAFQYALDLWKSYEAF